MKISPTPKLVIFDMDGTLLDTEGLAMESMAYAGKKMGADIDRQIFERMMGQNLASARRILCAEFGADFDFDGVLDIQNKYVLDYIAKNGVSTKPGALALLDKLDALGIKSCVATSTAKEFATHKLAAASVIHRFMHMVCGDEVLHSKPDPEIFLKAARECGFAPKDCIVVEDSEAGAHAALAADMRLIIVPDLCPLTDKIKAAAYAVCSSFYDVLNML